jgi:DNA end-binding protein Ku
MKHSDQGKRPARRRCLMPIAGKKPAKEASAKKPSGKPQRKSA